MSCERLEITQGNTGNLLMEITDEDDVAIDLTGALSVSFSMWTPGDTPSEITRDLVVTDAAAGEATLVVAVGDFDDLGTYVCTITVTFADGKIVTTDEEEIDVVAKAPAAAP